MGGRSTCQFGRVVSLIPRLENPSSIPRPDPKFFVEGGLLVFSAFLLHDTQRIIQRAELLPPDMQRYNYDPVNA